MVATDCIKAKGIEITLVKRSNLRRPRSPDLVQRDKTGITSVESSCTIIEAVM
jgi:hypothetical protein